MALSSIISKVFEHIIAERLKIYLRTNDNLQGVPKKKKDILNIHIKSEGIIIFLQKIC